jgi:plastocyanin
MPIQNVLVGSALIIVTGCQHSLVHDSMPTITRTGEVKDVVIQDTISPTSIMARPGDEIRWINKRQTDIQVTVVAPGRQQLICQRNFRQMSGGDLDQYAANVERNDTAGVCFRDPAELMYFVSGPSGEPNFRGTVMIAPEEQLWPSPQTPQTASLTKE